MRKSLQQVLNPDADDSAPFWLLPARRLPKELERGVTAYWGELRALEVVLEEIAHEFGGEDVLKPITREDLDQTRQRALHVQTVIQDWVEPFELPEANEEDVRQTRELIYKWADNRR